MSLADAPSIFQDDDDVRKCDAPKLLLKPLSPQLMFKLAIAWPV
jgi:hypothetical protein